jgi:hypothetical protein
MLHLPDYPQVVAAGGGAPQIALAALANCKEHARGTGKALILHSALTLEVAYVTVGKDGCMDSCACHLSSNVTSMSLCVLDRARFVSAVLNTSVPGLGQ